MRLFCTLLFLLATLAACSNAPEGLTLSPKWKAETLAEWHDTLPDMLAFSKDGKVLFISCETPSNLLAPSLARLDLHTGTQTILLYGLQRADALKMAPDGSLWLGEEYPDGLIWKVESPLTLPAEQRIVRDSGKSSSRKVRPVAEAGAFAHEGLGFSGDGRTLYLADEWEEGGLFRYLLDTKKLQVLHADKGWLPIIHPMDARIEAERLHAKRFARIEDMHVLPNGRILLAETGNGSERGRILVLDDRGEHPSVSDYFTDARLVHPDNLEWDAKRKWLWITDDDSPSKLWAFDGKELILIASHDDAEITGVAAATDGSIYFNLQHFLYGPDATVRIRHR